MRVRKIAFPEDLEAQLEARAAQLGLSFGDLVKLLCHSGSLGPTSAPSGPQPGPNGSLKNADTHPLGPNSAPNGAQMGPIRDLTTVSDPAKLGLSVDLAPSPSALPLPLYPPPALAVSSALALRGATERSGGRGGEGEGGEGVSPPADGNGHAKAARDALREAELRWRVEQVWASHVTAWRSFWLDVNGRVPSRAPLYSATDHGKPIREALLEFDRDLLGPDQRTEWLRLSTVRAAGVGIFYDPWCSGRAKDNDAAADGQRYLEHWRAWRRQRGKGSPVPKFAELYFEQRDAIEALETADA